jgi:hypothetical protein
MQYVEFIVTRPTTGAALPGAKVTVYLAGTTTPATLYNAAGGGISNPATADASGLIGFAAANGSYDFSAASADGSYVVPTIHRQQFYDLSGLDAQVALAQAAAAAAAATATAAIAATSGSAAAAAASAATSGSAAAAAVAQVSPLAILKTALLRQVVTIDNGGGAGAPTYSANGTETYAANAPYTGVYQLTPGDIAWATAGGTFTAIYQIVSGTVASAVFKQFNAAGTEVGTRPTVVITATEVSVRNIARATGAVKFTMDFTTASGSSVVMKRFGVSRGEPATAAKDTLLLSRRGYHETLANETPIVVPTVISTFASSPAYTSYAAGVWTVGPDGGNGGTLLVTILGLSPGDQYTFRAIRTNGDIYQPEIAIEYTGGAGPVVKQTEVKPSLTVVDENDPTRQFCEFSFIVPAASGPATGAPLRIRITDTNITGVTTFTDMVWAKGDNIPPEIKPSAAARKYIADAVAAGGGGGGSGGSTSASFIYNAGDSTSAQLAGYSVASWMSYYLGGMPYFPDGVATQTAEQVARRCGWKYPLLQVANLTIPATRTAVLVGNLLDGRFDYSTSPITNASNATDLTDPIPGSVGGVLGVLRSVRDGSNNVIGLDFLRDVAATDGQPTKVNRSTPFISTRAELGRGQINLSRIGNNNIGGDGVALGTTLAALHQMRIQRLTVTNERYIAAGILLGCPDPTSTDTTFIANNLAGLTCSYDANYTMSNLLSDWFHDDNGALTDEEWALFPITPTATDIADGDCTFIGSYSTSTGLLTVNSITSGANTVVRLYKQIVGAGIPLGSLISGGSVGAGFTLTRPPVSNLTSIPMLARGVIARSLRADDLHLSTTGGGRVQGFRAARRARQLGWYTGA